MPNFVPVDHDPFNDPLLPVDHDPFDPLAASAGIAPPGTPRIDQIPWGRPSWLRQALEQSLRDRVAFARGGVREMLRDTEGAQDLAGGFGGGGIAGRTENVAGIAKAAHPMWIDQRLPSGKKTVEEGLKFIGQEEMQRSPAQYEKNVGLIRNYPNMPEELVGAPTEDVAHAFIQHVKDNLLWLHDQVPEAIRGRSKLWYDGGNKLVKQWAKQYDVPEASAAGAIAAQSPQNDWFTNVSAAHRVLDTMRNPALQDLKMTPEMEQVYRNRPALSGNAEKGIKGYPEIFQNIGGKSLNDIKAMGLPPDEEAVAKAMWVRLHDEGHREQTVRLVTPEGEFGDFMRNNPKPGQDVGDKTKFKWSTLDMAAKAIRALDAGEDRDLMSQLMGGKHKVRNFYNNLLVPNAEHGDVTMDTHAVAAGLLRPLAGKDLEVSHNLDSGAGKGAPSAAGSDITGARGTYGLFADAYRQAAEERGILPREMQSITWEAVRGLFPDTFKTAKNKDIINGLWNEYRTGKASIDETRQKIRDTAGGIRPPDWVNTPATPHEAMGHPGNAPELSGLDIHGAGAGGVVAGGGGNAAQGIAPEGVGGFRAYHGSPHDFERFDLSKIGTGEGAQAYGHGLYFAEHPNVAQQYKDNLARSASLKGAAFNPDGTPNRAGWVAESLDAGIDEPTIREGFGIAHPELSAAQVDAFVKEGYKIFDAANKKGRMYEVNINADPEHFLDWDKPLSEQPHVIEKLKASTPYQQMAAANHFGYSPQEFAQLSPERQQKLIAETSPKTHENILWEGRPGHGLLNSFESSFGGSDKATQALREAGIPGIKYLDQGSRGTGTGTSNYVVFDDKLIDIIKKYGLAGLIAGGAAHFSTQPVEHDPFEARQ